MGRRDGDLRAKFPTFFAYDGERAFLTSDEAVAATPDDRIRSVWPFLVQRVLEFQKTLKPRERANFDAEDTIAECWIALREKDGKWEPGRGKYITFAGTIVDHALFAIRDKARTVQSPRNSGCRLKEYEAADLAGTITPRKARTAEAIRRTSGEFELLDGLMHAFAEGPVPGVLAREEKALARDAISLAVRGLQPQEAAVLGQTLGLWGRPVRTIDEIAAASGRRPDAIRRLKGRALAKVRDRLRAIRLGPAE